MNYAVEAKIFATGKIVAKMRTAEPNEESCHYETRMCEVWIDAFPGESEAEEFLRGYKRA